jgi:HAD superfamily hydrolase (TIGR01509 family)
MSAIFFGSIGTIADTSELQRKAFNQAFKTHGLDWCWSREDYIAMLEKSGGEQRIAEYASATGQTVDAGAVHQSKSEFFQKSLVQSQVSPRLGVVETIQNAKNKGLKLALVTTTSQANISLLINALSPSIQRTDFDLIVDASNVERPKPDKAAYTFALEQLGEKPSDCIVIEDNLGGVTSATLAGLNCIAFPGQNTTHHHFGRAKYRVDQLDFDEVQKFLSNSSVA